MGSGGGAACSASELPAYFSDNISKTTHPRSTTHIVLWYMVISQQDPGRHIIIIAPSVLLRNQEAIPSLMPLLPFYLSPSPRHLRGQVAKTYGPEKLGREILEDVLDNEVEAGRNLRLARYHTGKVMAVSVY